MAIPLALSSAIEIDHNQSINISDFGDDDGC
jgi:hypothetical protein